MTLPGDLFTQLFSESAARAVVAVRPGCERAFAALAARHGVPGQPNSAWPAGTAWSSRAASSSMWMNSPPPTQEHFPALRLARDQNADQNITSCCHGLPVPHFCMSVTTDPPADAVPTPRQRPLDALRSAQ